MKKYLISKNLLILFILSSIVSMPFYPVAVFAAEPITSTIKGGSCVTGSLLAPKLAPELEKQMDRGLDALKGKFLKIFGKKEVLEGTNLSFILGLSEPVPVKDEDMIIAYKGKETFGDILSRCFAREVLNTTVKGMLDIARTAGREGGPSFVKDWRKFETDAEYRGENIFRAMLASSNLCEYFGDDVKKTFKATKKTSLGTTNTRTGSLDAFKSTVSCSMPDGFDVNNYRKDFAGNGGWEAFSRLVQPQNNFYGVLFSSLDESSKQRSLEKSSDLNEALAGQGFTSKRGSGAADNCSVKGENGKCLVYKNIKTPGSVINDSVAATVKSELDWITNVDELSELVSTATTLIFNRLNDLGNPNEGDYAFYEEPEIADPPNTGEGNGDNPDPTPNEGIPPAPNKIGIVQAVAAEFPNYLANSCQDAGGSWQFMDEVVKRLHESDPKFGYNGKRGNINDPSKDAIAYYYGDGQPENGSYFVYIIDIISGHCGPSPSPAWQDVTAETIAGGTTGAYLFPR